MLVDRRSFLAAAFAATALPGRAAPDRIDRSRLSAITDEVARSPAESVAFAHTFGLEWLSLRDVPGPLHSPRHAYYALDPAAMSQAVREFKDAGIRISFLDTPFLKFDLPETQPIGKSSQDPRKRSEKNKALFDARFTSLHQGILASRAFECPMLRIFTSLASLSPKHSSRALPKSLLNSPLLRIKRELGC